jgi:hypothetical protein
MPNDRSGEFKIGLNPKQSNPHHTVPVSDFKKNPISVSDPCFVKTYYEEGKSA